MSKKCSQLGTSSTKNSDTCLFLEITSLFPSSSQFNATIYIATLFMKELSTICSSSEIWSCMALDTTFSELQILKKINSKLIHLSKFGAKNLRPSEENSWFLDFGVGVNIWTTLEIWSWHWLTVSLAEFRSEDTSTQFTLQLCWLIELSETMRNALKSIRSFGLNTTKEFPLYLCHLSRWTKFWGEWVRPCTSKQTNRLIQNRRVHDWMYSYFAVNLSHNLQFN